MVTSTAVKELFDFYDRRPLVQVPEAALKWMIKDVSGKESGKITGVF